MTSNKSKKHIELLNIEVDNITSGDLLNEFHRGVLFTPNIDHFVLLQHDKEFYEAYKDADVIILDSQIIYLLSKVFHLGFKEKISGSDFFPAFCNYHRSNAEVRIFLLGGLEDTADRLKEYLNANAQREQVVGAYSPVENLEMNDQECLEIIERIKRAEANVLAVAFGTPKQEKWIFRNRGKLPQVAMFMGVGASFDFLIGNQRRAPHWMQKAGLEWLYRLVKAPRRLAKRYLWTDLRFFKYFLFNLLRRYENPFKGM